MGAWTFMATKLIRSILFLRKARRLHHDAWSLMVIFLSVGLRSCKLMECSLRHQVSPEDCLSVTVLAQISSLCSFRSFLYFGLPALRRPVHLHALVHTNWADVLAVPVERALFVSAWLPRQRSRPHPSFQQNRLLIRLKS